MIEQCPDWNQRYLEQNTPWDSQIPSRELARVLDEGRIPVGPALELGCGTGTNAVFLAQRGFNVTAVDVSSLALEQARQRAGEAGVDVQFIEADINRVQLDRPSFDFVFDRGCYHCVRRNDLPGLLEVIKRYTRPGSKWLTLTGNANEAHDPDKGPPRLTEQEIRTDLGGLFDFDFIREIRFEDKGHVDGPLGWSCLMTRKG
jgi:SAM-dependent methyltransferase